MTSRRYLLFAAFAALPACTSSPEANRSAPPTENAASPVSFGAVGVLKGRVLFKGTPAPKPTRVENTTDPDHCGKVHSLEDILVDPRSRGVRNAIVSLTDPPLPPGYKPPPSRLVVDNRKCRFEPHVAVLTVGSVIEALNSDPIYHSVHLYGLKQLNVSLHTSRSKLIELPNRPGFLIVKCDVHGWMQAYIRVDRHPFHAVTDADGRFRIEEVPAGAHRVEIWHERWGPQEHSVTVVADATSEVTITYKTETQEKSP